MSLQSHGDRDGNPPMGDVSPPSREDILHNLRAVQEANHFERLYTDDAWYASQTIFPVVNLDSLSGLHIRNANRACNRTAPVFLVPDSWMHPATSCIFLEELLCYTHQRWFRPYESDIDRGQFLTKVCTVPNSPAPPTEACSHEMADYIKTWSTNLCARVAVAQSNNLDVEEQAAGERLYHMRPLFKAVAVAIRYSSFSIMVTDISTIPVLIVRTGVEDDLSAPVELEQVPESDRRAVVADSQGRLSAVEVTLEVAFTFLMALEKREEADGPVTRDVIQSTRVMHPMVDIPASDLEQCGWDEELMGPLMGPSSTWVDATKRPTWSGAGYESLQYYREMCVLRRQDAKPIMHVMQDGETWWRFLRETSGR